MGAGRRDRGGGHLALGLRLLAAAFAQLRLQPLVLRRQVLQLLLQRRAFCLHAVQKVAVDVVLGEEGRTVARGSWPSQGADRAHQGPPPLDGAAHLRLQLYQALPQLAALRQSLGLAQTHAHQLILQLAQDQLPRGLLPAATTGKMGLRGEAGSQPRNPETRRAADLAVARSLPVLWLGPHLPGV